VIILPIYLKLKELLQRKGITQKQLAEMTGLHESTLSDLTRDTRTAINKKHLELIMTALDIKDFNEILEKKSESYYASG
jgi:putative transcriptional regulator